jgi:adenine deaminase
MSLSPKPRTCAVPTCSLTHRSIPAEGCLSRLLSRVYTAPSRCPASARYLLGLDFVFTQAPQREEARETLHSSLPYREWIVGVGLDSFEVGNPLKEFKAVFD